MDELTETTPAFRSLESRTPLQPWQWLIVVFGSSRLLIIGIILLSRTIIVGGQFSHPGGLLSILTHWDGAWYLQIATQGYSYTPGHESNIGFFPLYPLLIRGLASILVSPALAAVVISNFCLLAAGFVFYELVRLDFDERVSRAAVTFLMFSPVSFFFSSAYSESTFLLLALGAFYAARRDRWLLACACGMCLSATRNLGVVVALPLFVEFVRQRWDPERGLKSVLDVRLLLFGLIPLGLAAFLLFGYLQFGDPLAYFHATAFWGRSLVPPWRTIAHAQALPQFYRILFQVILLGGITAFVASVVLKLRASYVVYAGAFIAVYLCGNSLEGIARYLSVVFPLFIAVGVLTARWDWLYEPLLATTFMLLTICTVLSANGYWMT